ncbi:MAG: 2OG-Fe(II) oxygenase [Cytophagales bacterium]|nr:2OG-Fe(II) oxygenase [Bernardetiaceae bacterium]MDW8203567.1 2OG-Fe(II) oxygenase [Cytophagales bacterium]
MELIDYQLLESRKDALKAQWLAAKPFHYVVFENFFKPEAAELILQHYPDVTQQGWEHTTYINQKNKFVMTEFEPGSILQQTFDELNGKKLLTIVEYITGIQDLIADPQLFGGGLHQSTKGAFLDVHVDFNYHPQTHYHRRMNILVYMNKDWKPEYNGYLELWDMSTKKQIEYIEPKFNRCVIFETNEISFHGHPKPLNTPPHVSRKSIAAYYYTKTRPESEIAADHNTIYVNTEGAQGLVKNFLSGIKALGERIKNKIN